MIEKIKDWWYYNDDEVKKFAVGVIFYAFMVGTPAALWAIFLLLVVKGN